MSHSEVFISNPSSRTIPHGNTIKTSPILSADTDHVFYFFYAVGRLPPSSPSFRPSFFLTVVKGNRRKESNTIRPSPDRQGSSSGVSACLCLCLVFFFSSQQTTTTRKKHIYRWRKAEAEKGTHTHGA